MLEAKSGLPSNSGRLSAERAPNTSEPIAFPLGDRKWTSKALQCKSTKGHEPTFDAGREMSGPQADCHELEAPTGHSLRELGQSVFDSGEHKSGHKNCEQAHANQQSFPRETPWYGYWGEIDALE
jgi:hypothetical protein